MCTLFGACPYDCAIRLLTNIPMNWTLLLIAGLLEVAWAIGLKYIEGFTRFWTSLGTAAAMLAWPA